MGKIVRRTVISLFCGLLVLVCSYLICSVYILENDVYKLHNSNDDILIKLDQLSDDTNAMWEERVFEKEMKENLAYYLPNGFNSLVQYTGLIPLDFEIGRARVNFIHRGKSYSVDFSYYTDKKGLQVERISNVIQLTE